MTTVTALPSTVDLQLVRATRNTFEVTLTNEAGVAVDITLDTVSLRVMTALGGGQVFILTNAPGQHSTPGSGKTRFTVTALQATTAEGGQVVYPYEVRRTQPDATVNVYIAGNLTVVPTA